MKFKGTRKCKPKSESDGKEWAFRDQLGNTIQQHMCLHKCQKKTFPKCIFQMQYSFSVTSFKTNTILSVTKPMWHNDQCHNCLIHKPKHIQMDFSWFYVDVNLKKTIMFRNWQNWSVSQPRHWKLCQFLSPEIWSQETAAVAQKS